MRMGLLAASPCTVIIGLQFIRYDYMAYMNVIVFEKAVKLISLTTTCHHEQQECSLSIKYVKINFKIEINVRFLA